MAKGKKGKKAAADDDWENDIGEEVAAIEEPPTATKEEEAPIEDASTKAPQEATADDFDDFGGGGLLGAIKKNKAKKKGKGGNKANDDDMQAALEKLTMNQEEPTSAAPPEATEDDFGAIEKGKKGKTAKEAPAASTPPVQDGDEDDDADNDGSGRVKTKKEKEKEKKEREKQRKKEQAARKKTTEPAKSSPAAAAPATPDPVEEKPEPSKPAPKAAAEPAGKKKKVPAALAALQRQQELRRQQEEEERELAEQAAREEEELRQKEEEEERRKEEAKQRKKEKEKEKREQQKKEGTFKTKAEKEKERMNEIKRQQLIDSGVKIEGLAEPDAPRKKPVYDKKKKKKPVDAAGESAEAEKKAKELQQKEEEEKLAAETKAKEEAEKTPEAEPEGDVAESWEAAAEEEDGVKDSWDMDTEDEEEAAAAKAKKEEAKKTEEAAKKAAIESKSGTNGIKKNKDDSESDSDDSSDEEEAVQDTAAQRQIQQKKDEAAARRQKQHEEALAARSKDNLRSPICCILGHVDTGKTKLLDKIRQTNVQEGEAGGITQQIGATYFPLESIKQKTEVVNQDGAFEFKIPGLLVIDTPGHESFTNLRSRGSSLCNIAILVVDIMHGLEPQTLESIRLLKSRNTPFIVALNKIDRLYSWKATPNNGFKDSLSRQNKSVQAEFKDRLERTKLAFAEQGLNSELFYENKTPAKIVSLVPTSAHTGEGIPDMLKLLVHLTQSRMTEKLMYLSEIECTVLEVKVIEGLGTTIDVVLSNGILREGDRIVICGLNGAITTNIRALLTPQPLKELRIKGSYVHHKEVKAALGIKIAANDMEDAIAGSRLLVVGPDDDEEDVEDEIMGDLEGLLTKVTKGDKGVSVQASTLGSLEALLEFLRVSKIPVMSISIGPVYKRDVMRAGAMLEKHKEFAVMLCFDVKVDKEAQAYADEVGVKLFTADIIYHLFDSFTAYQKELAEAKKRETAELAVFPCVLKIVGVFHQREPIVVGVDVIEGTLKIGTPIAVVKPGVPDPVVLGKCTSIELNHKAIPVAKKGSPSVAVKIEAPNQPTYGRHWEDTDTLYSKISRKSIDTMKEHFRDEVSKEEWGLMVQLKKVFKID